MNIRAIGLSAALALLAGCGGAEAVTGGDAEGPLQPVSGLVRKGGGPAAGVEVRLHLLNRARDMSAPVPTGKTGPDGRFTLALPDGRAGAPEGQYHIALAWPASPGGPDRLAGSYDDPEGSGLAAIISGPTELPPIDLHDRPAGAE